MTKALCIKAPYPGLRPYQPEEAPIFFGRDQQVNRLLLKLQASRFVALVGSSGSGKSSLLRAGLYPILGNPQVVGDSEWCVLEARPGANPFRSLATSLLTRAVELNESSKFCNSTRDLLAFDLRRADKGLHDQISSYSCFRGRKILLVIDQFEELFAYRWSGNSASTQEEDVLRFIQLLLDAASQVSGEVNIRIMISMRSDFIGACSIVPDLATTVSENQFLVPHLTSRQKLAAITLPGKASHDHITFDPFEIDPVLAHAIVNDTGERPDGLCLMQHALLRTWQYARSVRGRDSGPCLLTIDHYDNEAVGRVGVALDRDVQAAWNSIAHDPEQALIAKRLFLLLHDRTNTGLIVRRKTTVGEVCGVTEKPASLVARVVKAFQAGDRNFLLPLELDPNPDPLTSLDICHESLLREWRLFRSEWMREESRYVDELRRWYRDSHPPEGAEPEYLSTTSLARFEEWSSWATDTWALRYLPSIYGTDDESANRLVLEEIRAFAGESRMRLARKKETEDRQRIEQVLLRERERMAEEAKQQAEKDLGEALDELARKKYRNRISTLGLIFLSVLTIILTGYFFAYILPDLNQAKEERAQAEVERDRAEVERDRAEVERASAVGEAKMVRDKAEERAREIIKDAERERGKLVKEIGQLSTERDRLRETKDTREATFDKLLRNSFSGMDLQSFRDDLVENLDMQPEMSDVEIEIEKLLKVPYIKVGKVQLNSFKTQAAYLSYLISKNPKRFLGIKNQKEFGRVFAELLLRDYSLSAASQEFVRASRFVETDVSDQIQLTLRSQFCELLAGKKETTLVPNQIVSDQELTAPTTQASKNSDPGHLVTQLMAKFLAQKKIPTDIRKFCERADKAIQSIADTQEDDNAKLGWVVEGLSACAIMTRWGNSGEAERVESSISGILDQDRLSPQLSHSQRASLYLARCDVLLSGINESWGKFVFSKYPIAAPQLKRIERVGDFATAAKESIDRVRDPLNREKIIIQRCQSLLSWCKFTGLEDEVIVQDLNGSLDLLDTVSATTNAILKIEPDFHQHFYGVWLQEGCAVAGAILVKLAASAELSLLNSAEGHTNLEKDKIRKVYLGIRNETCDFPLSWDEFTERHIRTPEDLFKAQNENRVGSFWSLWDAEPKSSGLGRRGDFEATLSLGGTLDGGGSLTRRYKLIVELRGSEKKPRYKITKATRVE